VIHLAIAEGLLGASRAAIAAFTVGLLLTFLGVRLNTRLIRARVSWWFHDIESKGGLHVHHMVIGIVVMVAAGISLIAFQPSGGWLQLVALLFGVGVALTLDEFALILRLQDVYWTAEGRLSVDAVVVALCAGVLLVVGLRPLGHLHVVGATGLSVELPVAVVIVIDLLFSVTCLLKGKLWTGFFSVFIPVVGIIGAVRLARPWSPWAHRRYGARPDKLAKAERREDHLTATWLAWRTALFDLVAGKPHLPSVTLGPGTDPAEGDGEEAGGGTAVGSRPASQHSHADPRR
jgi:lysyl-tRNA synthetase class 2